jgi:hypothetical protein
MVLRGCGDCISNITYVFQFYLFIMGFFKNIFIVLFHRSKLMFWQLPQIKKVALKSHLACVFRMLLVGLFDQFQLLPFITLDHFHDVHTRCIPGTHLDHSIFFQVGE